MKKIILFLSVQFFLYQYTSAQSQYFYQRNYTKYGLTELIDGYVQTYTTLSDNLIDIPIYIIPNDKVVKVEVQAICMNPAFSDALSIKGHRSFFKSSGAASSVYNTIREGGETFVGTPSFDIILVGNDINIQLQPINGQTMFWHLDIKIEIISQFP